MNGPQKVIYWHRLGLKVYSVNKNSPPVVEKEVESSDVDTVIASLKYLNGQSLYLLLADSISYFFEKVIEPPIPVDSQFKTKLLNIIKADIPEDFSQFNWDYKLVNNPEGVQTVQIFAPIKQFQNFIKTVSDKLSLTFIVIENESIAASRDPNPVLGIIKKADVAGKDEDVLNISLIPESKKKKSPFLLISVFIFLISSSVIFLYSKNQKSVVQNTTPTPTVTISVPTISPTPTIKSFSELTLMIQNGTKTSGLASKTAKLFNDRGIINIQTANADNNDYPLSKIIFKDQLLKEKYFPDFNNVISITETEVSIDNTQSYDAILILGAN